MTSLLSSLASGLMSVKAEGIPDGDFLRWMLTSVVAHAALFLVLPASPWLPKEGESPPGSKGSKPFNRAAESIKIRNGLVSTLHACVCIVSVLCWFAHYSFDPWDWQSNMQGGVAVEGNANGHDWYALVACNTVGYFVYDFLAMIYYHRVLGNTGSYVHHVVLSVAMSVGIWTGLGRSYHCLYTLEEFSTPALNMKNLYPHGSTANKIWSAIFAGSFFLCRGLFGLTGAVTTYWCLYTYWVEHRDEQRVNGPWLDILTFLNFFSFTVSRLLNIYWMGLIARKVCGSGKKKTKKVAPAVAKMD